MREREVRPHARTTLEFSPLHDHARLPARFFGRLRTTDLLGISLRSS